MCVSIRDSRGEASLDWLWRLFENAEKTFTAENAENAENCFSPRRDAENAECDGTEAGPRTARPFFFRVN
jgi:hypothetical protein